MFAQGSFVNDANLTPEQIARKRAMIAALMPQFGNARYVGEGLGQLATGIAMGRQNRRLDKQEQAGLDRANDVFSRLTANPTGNGGFSVLGLAPQQAPADMGPVKIDNAPTTYDPKAPWAIGMDAMTAIGKTPSPANLEAGLVARGMSPVAAKGSVMAMNDESGLNPSINEKSPIVQGSRGGFGLNQWTGDRRVALEKYAQDTGRDVRDPQVQLDFQMQELQGPEARAGQSVMSAQTPEAAAAAMTRNYLRPADVEGRVAKYQPQIPSEQLYAALANPWLSQEQKDVISGLIAKQEAQNVPKEPIKVGGVLLDPVTFKPIFDGRDQGGGPDFGKTPITFYDNDGNPRTGFMDANTGKIVPAEVVGGGVADPMRSAADTSNARAVGKASGEAKAAIPGAGMMMDAISSEIDALKNDPYLDSMLGPLDSRKWNFTADAARVQGKMDQIQSGAFLQARQLLKGGGAITDYESGKAEAAFARLSAAQNSDDYKAALDDFMKYVRIGVDKLQAQAGMAGAQPADSGLSEDEMKWMAP